MFHDDVVGCFGNHGGMFAGLWVDPIVEVSHHLWNKVTCTNGVLTLHCPLSVMGIVPTPVLGKVWPRMDVLEAVADDHRNIACCRKHP